MIQAPIIISAIALSLAIISLVFSIFSFPKVLESILGAKAKELSTHTVVPGQLFDMMEKNPDFMPSADDIEYPRDIGKKETKKPSYG